MRIERDVAGYIKSGGKALCMYNVSGVSGSFLYQTFVITCPVEILFFPALLGETSKFTTEGR